jgi:uncharacterized damage-inducible protein DinB
MSFTPEQALLLLNETLATLEHEHQLTMRVVEAVPADKADYRPDPNATSAFDLCWHMASAEYSFLGGAAAGDFGAPPKVEKVKTMPEVVSFYKDSFAKNLAALKSMTGEQAAKILDFHGMFQMPAVSFISFTLRHELHHRGQLTVYLRPMGGKVPAVYGESYDSKAAKAAQN